MIDSKTGWDAERIEIVKMMKSNGASASQIGERVGRTRNAVLGLLFRMGLSAPHRPRPQAQRAVTLRSNKSLDPRNVEAEERAMAEKARRLAEERAKRLAAAVDPRAEPSQPRPTLGSIPATMGKVRWMKRRFGQCAWVTSDLKPGLGMKEFQETVFVCGLPTEQGMSMCEVHHRLCYVPHVKKFKPLRAKARNFDPRERISA